MGPGEVHDVVDDLSVLSHAQLLAELARARRVAELTRCPAALATSRHPVVAEHAAAGCGCERLLELESEVRRRLPETRPERRPGVVPAVGPRRLRLVG